MSSNISLSNTSNSDGNSGSTLHNIHLEFMLALEVFIIPVIVCGNLLIIAAMIRFKALRYSSNMMILSLSIADLMMGGVYLPLKIVYHLFISLFHHRMLCLWNIFFSIFCVFNAMSFLAMLSIERCYAVQFPYHYHSHMTVTRSLIWSGVTVLVSLLFCLPSICGVDLWNPGKKCFTSNIMPRYYLWSGVLVIFLISFIGFLSFLRVMAAEIMIRMRDNARNVNEARKQDSVKSTLMLTVYVFSIICWIPQLIYTCISVFKPENANRVAIRIVSFLGICSSGVNCFIYGTKNSKFRMAFKNIFRCRSSTVEVLSTTRSSTHQTDA